MAIGDFNNGSSSNGYQNNNSNKPFEATYYSRLRFKNGNDMINVSYRSGLMILELGSTGNEGFKFTPAIAIYISPMKARLLASEIDAFLAYRNGEDIDPARAFGVNTGMGEKISYIGFSTDEEKGIKVTIGKFDGNGKITEYVEFNFAQDYHYSLEWNDISANDLVKIFDNTAEILTLKAALEDFSRGMSGAIGYGVVDLARWDNYRTNKKFDQIFDKLGIERKQYNGGGNYGGSNNFLNNASSSSKSTTIEDVEDLLG